MYSRDPFNLRSKAPPSALTFLQSAATKTIETGTSAVETTKQALKDADMSFAIPRNVPNFENAQRRFEDNVWNKFTGNEKGLPMYKDKPANHGARGGMGRLLSGKRGVGVVVLMFMGLFYWLGWFGGTVGDAEKGVIIDGEKSGGWKGIISGKKGQKVDWEKRRDNVREAFLLSWKAYEEHGWGWSLYILH